MGMDKTRSQTPIREITSSDQECFDEKVERAIAIHNLQAGIQARPAQRPQQNGFVGVPQVIRQNGQSYEEHLVANYEDLEAKLADVMQTHLAYTQQVHNTMQSIVFEVMGHKDKIIAELQTENNRLQHQQSFSTGGHNAGGTGDSNWVEYSSPVKKQKETHVSFAWNNEGSANSLRDAARETKIAAFPTASAGPSPPTGAGVVGLPQHEPPKMLRPTTADSSVSIQPVTNEIRSSGIGTSMKGTSSSKESPRASSLEISRTSSAHSDQKGTRVSVSSALLGGRMSSVSVSKRQSVAVSAKQARLATKEAKETGKKTMEEDMKQDKKVKDAVFIDATAMKEKVKAAVMRPEYNVVNFYKNSGIWQYLARNVWFENITLSIIAFNALWIAVDTDRNKAPTLISAHPVFIVAENTFCAYFTFELLCRFLAFRSKRDCLRDSWFVFDSALVIMMILETWVMSAVLLLTDSGGGASLGDASILRLVRLLRLTRMARMARLLRAMPELMILIKGISVATRSVFFTLCLLTIIIYVFAIAFAQLSEDTILEDEYFKTVPDAMSSLLLKGVLPDQADFVNGVGEENPVYGMVVLFFILLSSLTVMNMLVGVLVEVVSVVSSVEKEQMTVSFVKNMIQSMLEMSGVDANEDKQISRPEFESLLLKPEAARIIQEVGVDVVGLVDFADFIFRDGNDLTFAEFMEIVLQLRGNNTATVRDIVDLRKFVLNEITSIHSALSSMSTSVSDKLQDAMTSVTRQTNDNIVMAMRTGSEAVNASPIQPQMVDTTMADAANNNNKGRLGMRFRGAKPNSNMTAFEWQMTPNSNRVGQSRQNPSPTSSRPTSAMSSASRPASGMGVRPTSALSSSSRTRPWSGVSNPQPLPAFPDHMWITELEESVPVSNTQEASQRRVGQVKINRT